jgi:DNA-binding response OmpR family regulator
MIVDDEPAVRFTVEKVLRRAHLQVQSAASGRECLQQLQDGFRGLILLDIMMPGMDGWQTLQSILDNRLAEGNVVCMLTAVQNPGQEMEGLKDCVMDYIRKPFEPDALLERIDQYLAWVA